MNFLLCSEFFHPAVGGAQEVVKQVALGLLKRGHDVTVATTAIKNRITDNAIDGVKIAEFMVSGNLVQGISGDMDLYRRFVVDSQFDAILIYAAQQWTLDALLDVLICISARKILVPCGFSGLYQKEYQAYFNRLQHDLKYFDTLVFHSLNYRDYEFAKNAGIKNCVFIPNGASEDEFFNLPESRYLRHQLGIDEQAFIILTVGSLNGAKGHLEVARSISKLKVDKKVHLLLNGNPMPISANAHKSSLHFLKKLNRRLIKTSIRLVVREFLSRLGLFKTYKQKVHEVVALINSGRYGGGLKASIVDLGRPELIKCFFEADLFVFASKIEYSPLVLFEAAAAGLPFLTTPVGNAREIVQWTKGGRICDSLTDANGFAIVDPTIFAKEIELMINHEADQIEMKRLGRENWKKYFTWSKLVGDYEKVLMGATISDRRFEMYK